MLGKKSELSRLKRGETANCMISHKHKSTYKLFTWLALSFCCNYLPFFLNRENTPSVLTFCTDLAALEFSHRGIYLTPIPCLYQNSMEGFSVEIVFV